MTTGTRRTGEFCWINILTAQPAAACDFFGKLLGWMYVETPGMHLIQVDGEDVGGLFDLADPMTPPGTPPVIGVMVKVDNAGAMVEKVKSLGGTAAPAFDIMENGRMAMCHDPSGANFDLWEPKKQQGLKADSSHHGAPSWFEALTPDADRAAKFYSELFGWTSEVMPMPDLKYTTFKLGAEYVGGMLETTPEMGDMPPHWATYFTVNDVDESVRMASELGGSVFMPAKDVPGVGRFSGMASPQGVHFYVIKYAA